MNTLIVKYDAKATAIHFTKGQMQVALKDGRMISVPLAYFPKLMHATAKQLNNWRLIGNGIGIHWEILDEDLSVDGLLAS